MRMSALAGEAGLPVATVKYYLREGLLHPGESTSATRSEYDASHVRRLRLVRALTDVAGMSLDGVRAVLEAVDDPSLSWHEAVGAAHTRLSPDTPEPSTDAQKRVSAFLRRRRWRLSPESPHARSLGRAIDALAGLDHPASDRLLDVYADAAITIAEHEVAGVNATDHAAAAEHVVVGTLLQEPLLLAIRRIAQENVSARTRGRRGAATRTP